MATCVTCKKEVKTGDWMCNSIERHELELKHYYMKDAPQDPTAFNFKHAKTDVHNIPPQRAEKGEGGLLQIIPGGFVTFKRDEFCTTDPEQQYNLDRKQGLCSKEEWEANYFTVAEKQERRNSELAKREAAIAARENELLVKIKQEKAGGKAISA